jgi:hypothetical protein
VEALETSTKHHEEVLRQEKLITDRPMRTIHAGSQIIIQVLEWNEHLDETVPTKSAHTDPAVQKVWAELAASAEFVPFGKLAQRSLPGVAFTVVRPSQGADGDVKRLLIQYAQAVRREGLAHGHSILTVQSDVDGTFLQMIELSKSGTEKQMAENPNIQRIRVELSRKGKMLNLSALPESGCPFASLALVSEN